MSSNKYPLFDFENKERPSFLRRLKLKWDFEWKYLPRDIKIGFKNLYYWFPIIWSDRDWDYSYMYEMMNLKIRRMSDYHKNKRYYVGWENTVKWMNIANKLIEKINSEYYSSECHDYYDVQFWCTPVDSDKYIEKEYVEIDTETTWECLDDYLNRYPLQIDTIKSKYQELKNEKVDFSNKNDKKFFAMLLSYHNHQRAKQLLFKILNEKLENWRI